MRSENVFLVRLFEVADPGVCVVGFDFRDFNLVVAVQIGMRAKIPLTHP